MAKSRHYGEQNIPKSSTKLVNSIITSTIREIRKERKKTCDQPAKHKRKSIYHLWWHRHQHNPMTASSNNGHCAGAQYRNQGAPTCSTAKHSTKHIIIDSHSLKILKTTSKRCWEGGTVIYNQADAVGRYCHFMFLPNSSREFSHR